MTYSVHTLNLTGEPLPTELANQAGVSQDALTFDTIEGATNSMIHKVLRLEKLGWQVDSYECGVNQIVNSWVAEYDMMGETFTVQVAVWNNRD